MQKVNSLEIPVNMVYYIPAGSGKVFLGVGPYLGFNLKGKSERSHLFTYEGSISLTTSKFDLKFSGPDRTLNFIDTGVNFLTGYKLNIGLLINAGYGLGMSNLNPDLNSDSYSNRLISVGIGYEFQ